MHQKVIIPLVGALTMGLVAFAGVTSANATPPAAVNTSKAPALIEQPGAGLRALIETVDLGPGARSALDPLVTTTATSRQAASLGDGVVTSLPTAIEPTTSTVNVSTGAVVEVAVPTLPSVDSRGSVSVVSDGRGESAVVHATATGAQILFSVESPAPSLSLDVETTTPTGSRWVPQRDGSLHLRDDSGMTAMVMGAPWAIDARGRALETRFAVDDNTITQLVDSSDAQFPVVADPSLWWYVGTSALCAAEIASLAVGGAKVIAAFAKADRIIKAAKTVSKYYKALGGSVKKVVDKLKKYIKKHSSLTKRQRVAMKRFLSSIFSTIANLIGLGSCYALYAAARN